MQLVLTESRATLTDKKLDEERKSENGGKARVFFRMLCKNIKNNTNDIVDVVFQESHSLQRHIMQIDSDSIRQWMAK